MGVNKSIIVGRTVRDAEIFKSQQDKYIAKLTVAVDNGFGEHKETSYINITAFGKTAEFCEKYVGKGRLVSVVGRIKTGSYTKKDGTKQPTFEIIVEELQVLDSAKDKPEGKSNTDFGTADYSALGIDIPF